MTQLELPPISFARYLDLLKRRRWQVLPVSILGLLVGAIVAFMIPRYYVCQTSVLFRGAVLGAGEGRDPMAPLVAGAENSIRYAVGAALDQLGWPEVAGSDEERRSAISSVRSRVQVVDLGPHGDRRMITNLRIIYKDTDPYRAKEVTNTLREIWISEEQRELRDRADRQMKLMTAEIGLAKVVLDNAEIDLTSFARRHKLNPLDFINRRDDGVLSAKSKERETVESLIAKTASTLAGNRAARQARKEQLATTQRRTTKPRQVSTPPEIQTRIDLAAVQVVIATRALENVREGHQDYPVLLQRQRQRQQELAALQAAVGGPATAVEIDNPNYARLSKEIDDLTAKIADAESELVRLGERKASLDEEILRLPPLLSDYRAFVRDQEKAKADLEQLDEEYRAMVAQKKQLLDAQPYQVKEEAQVPPRPTDPNIMLVALAGSAVGLAFAIGLVLLIDVLQTTFKTPTDVERQLSLPVLGGMSYLITAERKKLVHNRRTKAGVVAGVFLVLSLSLITIYYVDKTRLPPVVRDTLEMLLGPTEAASAPR